VLLVQIIKCNAYSQVSFWPNKEGYIVRPYTDKYNNDNNNNNFLLLVYWSIIAEVINVILYILLTVCNFSVSWQSFLCSFWVTLPKGPSIWKPDPNPLYHLVWWVCISSPVTLILMQTTALLLTLSDVTA